MGFPRQEYWSGLPFPSPGNLPDPGIGPVFCISKQILYRFWPGPAVCGILVPQPGLEPALPALEE